MARIDRFCILEIDADKNRSLTVAARIALHQQEKWSNPSGSVDPGEIQPMRLGLACALAC
jgi:hypothetical protein